MKEIFEDTPEIAKRVFKLYFAPLVTIKKFWVETWRESKVLFLAEMFGTLFGMAAAAMMGFQSPNPNLLVIFTCYNISAVLLIYSNYIRHSAWMVVLMFFYLTTTLIGTVRLF